MNTIILENWSTVSGGDEYTAPECRTLNLHGEVYGHPRFEDGKVIVSSEISKINCRFVTTRSGSLYWLGKPDPNFVKWCEENGGHVPTQMEPIKTHA